MKAEILAIGDELLIGQTINTNAAWMGEQLNLIGIDITQTTAIPDKADRIIEALNEAAARADIILITGGLGPTKDDITKHTLCKYFNTTLEINEEVLARITEYFTKRGRELLEVNKKQAEIPVGCIMLPNPKGTAQGMWFEKEGKIFISMPGVPGEMKAIMSGTVLPEFQKKFTDEAIVHRTILTQGIGESFLADKIKDWENELRSAGLNLAYLPSPGVVKLRITAKGKDETTEKKKVNAFAEKLYTIASEFIFGEGHDKLEEIIGKILLEKNKWIGVAESCTGGYISHLITSVPGSSNYYKGSVISYAYEAKEDILGIDHEMLMSKGAVSEECSVQMALSAKKILNVDYCISTTGVAGPGGGTDEKPVGTVWICVTDGNNTIAKKFVFGNNRDWNIQMASATALNMLRKLILGIQP